MKILIADDESLVCTIFTHHINQYGSPYISFEFVCDGNELIEKCASDTPDLIITDIKMPNMSGLEAIEEIRKTYSDKFRIYILSGFTDFELVRSALQLGVVDYIPKPIKYGQIKELLEKEEKRRYMGLELEDAYKMNDEELALHLSEIIQKLAYFYSNKDKKNFLISLDDYNRLSAIYSTKIESAYFFEKFNFACGKDDQISVLKKISDEAFILDNDLPIVDKIKNLVKQNFSNVMFGLDTVSAELGYSTQYLSMTFKKETGENFSSYLTRKRIEQAKKLLMTTNMKIKDIASACGYNYTNYFIKVFNRQEKLAPAEWKSTMKNN